MGNGSANLGIVVVFVIAAAIFCVGTGIIPLPDNGHDDSSTAASMSQNTSVYVESSAGSSSNASAVNQDLKEKETTPKKDTKKQPAKTPVNEKENTKIVTNTTTGQQEKVDEHGNVVVVVNIKNENNLQTQIEEGAKSLNSNSSPINKDLENASDK